MLDVAAYDTCLYLAKGTPTACPTQCTLGDVALLLVGLEDEIPAVDVSCLQLCIKTLFSIERKGRGIDRLSESSQRLLRVGTRNGRRVSTKSRGLLIADSKDDGRQFNDILIFVLHSWTELVRPRDPAPRQQIRSMDGGNRYNGPIMASSPPRVGGIHAAVVDARNALSISGSNTTPSSTSHLRSGDFSLGSDHASPALNSEDVLSVGDVQPVVSQKPNASERTPLLSTTSHHSEAEVLTPINYSAEDYDDRNSKIGDSPGRIWIQELKMVSQYTAPIFGCVHSVPQTSHLEAS